MKARYEKAVQVQEPARLYFLCEDVICHLSKGNWILYHTFGVRSHYSCIRNSRPNWDSFWSWSI